ncbi:MAG: hypothetical protein OEW18_02595 [Candidatus Aminicenantes bacterium]|nr:hypothetical protein [Candidatus Aminicenantes bacterium]
MEDRMESGRADRIQELIQREKEDAERNFESSRFDARLFGRIQSASEASPKTWFVFLRKPRPVIALSALLLAIAGFLFFRKLSPSPFEQTVRAMSAVLDDAGDGRQMKEQDSMAPRIATAEYTEFGWALKGVLYACERESLGDVELADALSRVFLKEDPRAASRQGGANPPLPRADSLQLKSGEDFQSFFSGFLKKFEEV